MVELRQEFAISTLVAEARAAAERLDATIVVSPLHLGARMQRAADEIVLRIDTIDISR